MNDVITIQGAAAVREFLSRKGNKRTGAHAFTKRVKHWPYCDHCGLVLLKNDVSRRAAAKPCVTYED